MKQLLIIAIAMIGLTQTATASDDFTYKNMSLTLVHEELSKELYDFDGKIVNFAFSKDHKVALLQISQNLCPKINGQQMFTCMARPAVVLAASFPITKVSVDGCNVLTMESGLVGVANAMTEKQQRSSLLVIKDYTKTKCKMKYSDVVVELRETAPALDDVIDSTMLFNYYVEQE